MLTNKPTVLFLTEASYPFAGGGVSTWANILCHNLKDRTDFIVLAVTGSQDVKAEYSIPENVKTIIHVPLWGVEEPTQYINSELSFSSQVMKKYRTDSEVIRSFFIPMFRDFLKRLFTPYSSAREMCEVIYGFWKYYQYYDYKVTLSHHLVWREFKRFLRRLFIKEGTPLRNEEPCLLDITFGKRWIYHFMMPLVVPLPRISATHATLAGFPAVISIAAKYEYGTPMLVTDHGIFIRETYLNISRTEGINYFSKRILLNMATCITRAVYHASDIICPVTSINAKWEREFEGVEKKIQPIYNGVDTKAFYPRPKPSHRKRPTVVAAAHIFPLKDIETMILSCEYVRREIPDVHYLLYGRMDIDEEYTAKCRQLVNDLGLEENFTFGGFHSSPNELFCEGDISILSSISEGFPYTVIESMSCGRPVVATDVGGVKEAIGECGIACKPREAGDLGEGVIRFLQDDEYRQKMGRHARKRVINQYTIPQSVNSYFDLYHRFHEKSHQPMANEVTLKSVRNFLRQFSYVE